MNNDNQCYLCYIIYSMGIAHAVKKLDVFFEKSLHACKLPKVFVTRRVRLFCDTQNARYCV